MKGASALLGTPQGGAKTGSLESSEGTAVEFRILGPFEVLRDGEPIDVGPHKQQSLLALLLIHANRVVPTDRILENLWGDEADGKENALWVYVSRLRTALEGDAKHAQVLVTRDHGYVLRVEADSIDALRFEQAVVHGRSLLASDPEEASVVLHEALELWSGSALQDFTYDNFAQVEIARLEELRTGAIEDAFEADLRIGKAGELIGDLEALCHANPLRERPTSQLMLALYRAGRSADALRTFERFRRTIGEELGIDPSPELCRLEEQILLHDSRLQLRRSRHTVIAGQDIVNPFRGLQAFSEEDAAVFFGRDRLVAEAVRRLSDGDRLIAFVGPSGSGKSSAVRAGLVPAIRKGSISGSDRWLVAHMLPGSDPLIELEAALLRSTIDAPDSLAEPLSTDDGSGLVRAVLRVLPTESSRPLLIIDQFEELFTLVENVPARRRFLDQLVGAIDDPYGRVLVVVTLRADFYRRILEHAEFATRMGTGVVNVVPLAPDELEAAALEPAHRSGVTLEPALLAGLVADVIGQPGALPMFQYTLTELFDRRIGGSLTLDAYQSMGGVRGSLTRSADELYDQLDDGQQTAAKQLLLRLVAVTEDDEWSRRRVSASELTSLDVDVVAMQRVVELFARHRLLALDRDQVTGAPTVEVAHEALLSEWERLRTWIEQHRGDLLRYRELAGATTRWRTAGRDTDYVYTGGRLDDTIRWSETTEMTITAGERAFLDAGLERRQAESARDEAHRSREQRLERTTRWRTRAMIATVILLGVVLVGVAWAVTRPPGPKIALVYEGAAAGQSQALILDGWEQAQREFGFQGAVIESLIDPVEDMRELANAGYELVVYGRFDQGAAAFEVAAELPDTSFVILDGRETTGDNVTALDFIREGGAYLMGVAAALRSETGRVGFIGGRQTDTTEARRAAFTAGARSISQDISVDAVYLGPYHDAGSAFLDVDLARETASEMYQSGTDVIHHSAGNAGEGIAAAAAELTDELDRELWVIGTEVDEKLAIPEYQDRYLTSMWKRWDRAVYESVRAYLDDDLTPGRYELGMDGAFVGYSRDGGLFPSDAATLDEIGSDIVDGRVVPPSVARDAPRWTRTPDVTAKVVFDGGACSIDTPTSDLNTGDVVRLDAVNRSDQPVRFAIGTSPDDLGPAEVRSSAADPWEAGILDSHVETLVEAGERGALAARLTSGTFFVDCLAADGSVPGTELTTRFETTCEGPDVESDDPVDVVRALDAAINARDAAAVCSLFADDGPVPGEVMADWITPKDDERWFRESIASDIDVTEDVVTWKVTNVTATGVFTVLLRAKIANGEIFWLEVESAPE